MNYESELVQAGRDAVEARKAATSAEAARDYMIRAANYHGGLSVREISGAVGISHQRVSQIISADPIAPKRPTLHEEMLLVLKAYGTDWVPVHEVARQITLRGRYQRRDRLPVPPSQVRARASKYPDLFEGTTDGTNRIRRRPMP